MTRSNRSDEELRRSSEHLHYEYWMMTVTSNALSSGIAERGWLLNALLESYVIHLRSLLDFMYSENPKKDDVIASDFFLNDGEWETIRPELTEELKNAKLRAHKEIAHLTYERLNVTPETKPWAILEISNEIHAIMNVFIDNASKNLLSPKWNKDNNVG